MAEMFRDFLAVVGGIYVGALLLALLCELFDYLYWPADNNDCSLGE